MNATRSAEPYRLPVGFQLSSAEAAHLLTREAAGERLPCIPLRTPAGYVLALRLTLTPAEREKHRERVTRAAQVLSGLPEPLSAALTA